MEALFNRAFSGSIRKRMFRNTEQVEQGEHGQIA